MVLNADRIVPDRGHISGWGSNSGGRTGHRRSSAGPRARRVLGGAMAEMVLPPAPPNMTYKVEKLNPLAFPKGMDLRCELTGKPALVRPHGSKRPRSHRPESPRPESPAHPLVWGARTVRPVRQRGRLLFQPHPLPGRPR